MNLEELEKKKIETEKDYIEAMNHLKEEYEKFNIKEKVLKNEILELKKELITLYGGIRFLDFMVGFESDIDRAIVDLIENLRGVGSQMIEQYI